MTHICCDNTVVIYEYVYIYIYTYPSTNKICVVFGY